MSTPPREFTYWDVIWRRDATDTWMDWGSYSTEELAREVVAQVHTEYAHYDVALREITKTVKHIWCFRDEVGTTYGRCDTCGSPCNVDGCTNDRTHEAALEAR